MTFRTEEQILASFKARFGIAHTAISNRDWFAEIFGVNQPVYSTEVWLEFPPTVNYYANHDGGTILDNDITRTRTWNGAGWDSVAGNANIKIEKIIFPLTELLSTNGQSHIALVTPQAPTNSADITPSMRLRDFVRFVDFGTDFLPRLYWDNGSGTGIGAEIKTTSLPNQWLWDESSGLLLCGADVTDQFIPLGNLPIWIQHYRYIGAKDVTLFHRTLRHLIHFVDEGPGDGFISGAFKETLPAGSAFPTSVIWWESSAKLKKIVERIITWTGTKVSIDAWKMYDVDGSTVIATVSDAISYIGVFETNRIRTIT